jgi:DNA topoisomerase-2
MSDGESDEAATKPVKKKKTTTTENGKAGPSNNKALTQRKISKSMKPASPPKKSLKRLVVSDSDSEMMDYDDLPKPPARAGSGMRAARGVAKKYVEIVSDEEGSLFGDE